MDINKEIKETEQLFLELFPLYYHKFGAIFREDDGLPMRCTKNQKRAILLIAKGNDVTSSELGRCLDMRKGSLTSLLDSLEEMGLVRRNPDDHDRRRTLLYLTADGKNYFAKMMKRHENMFTEIISTLSPEDIKRIRHGLRDVVDGLKNI
ncbi:MarR family winged helix-turn-helix transcriptional regulator [Dethiobacter alkaliphilus]|uniref:MarR family winged helix-turn-helix transcriptional regulator n=1 Tax=Dethiobacter alkaliphilus TaxID=427926 RepID=UPI0022271F68|nr:MarR family winged helix-turn-helix transcriptional regulator [Dethiobacter alkaliphilus]MCW3490524.1 MarR family winged helix-turn-helix transcriptional regulator [Dethiobacter alkaliphilus]